MPAPNYYGQPYWVPGSMPYYLNPMTPIPNYYPNSVTYIGGGAISGATSNVVGQNFNVGAAGSASVN